MWHIIREYLALLHCAVLVLTCLMPAVASAYTLEGGTPVPSCSMAPLEEVVHGPTVMAGNRRNPEEAYRRTLTRFVAQHYSKLARDIAQQQGEYLHSLHILLGIRPEATADCNQMLRDMLVNTQGSNSFTQVLLLQRLSAPPPPDSAETYPSP